MSTKNNTRYSMRLRQNRGGDALGSSGGGNDGRRGRGGVAASSRSTRAALGDIAVNNHDRDDNDEAKTKPKKTNVRRGRSLAKKVKEEQVDNPAAEEEEEEEEEKKPAAKRRSSSRRTALAKNNAKGKGRNAEDAKAAVTKKKGGAAIKKEKVAAAPKPAAKKEAAKKNPVVKKETTTATAAVDKKETKAKKGVKRSSSSRSDNNGPTITRPPSKRSKQKSDTTSTTAIVTVPRTTRSRSPSGTSSRRNRSTKKKPTMRPIVVDIIPASNAHSIIPRGFGLKRDTFNGYNFTYGIAHYDAPDKDDSLLCKGYVTDMFQQLYHAETKYRTTPYIDNQEDINAKMRAILIDWLVDVHVKFRLEPQTLYLCVQIIDRYCSLAKVSRSKLQLVGVTALFLACKHEEIYPPEVRDCVYITDRAYDRQEVLDMEQDILRVLNWQISLPTAYPFLERFLSLTNASTTTRHAASYYMERTLQEHDLLEFRPSMVCASAVILALNNPDICINERDHDCDGPGLPKVLMEYTEFDTTTLWKCMSLVAEKVGEPTAVSASRRHLHAVKKKYATIKYHSVSSDLELPNVAHVRLAEEAAKAKRALLGDTP